MKKSTTSAAVVPAAIIEDAWQEVGASFERFWSCPGFVDGYGFGRAGGSWLLS